MTPCPCWQEGVLALWKGNNAVIVRIIPYSAIRETKNDTQKNDAQTLKSLEHVNDMLHM